MNFQKRKGIIIDLLEEKGELNVRELSQHLKASEITVRRDLIQLAADGLLFRTHGGAMRVDLIRKPHDFAHKVASRVEEKDYICRIAASLVEDGDVIFLDCGSTVFRLCSLIRNKEITVVTNSLPVVYELQNSSVRVNLAGGEVDQERLAMHGRVAEEHIGRYQAHKAFLGVDGISAEKGLTAHSEKEAGMTLAMMASAAKTFLLADTSKIGKNSYLQFAALKSIDHLITNGRNEEVARLEAQGLDIIC